jgi:POT family proton-dependent oligopeptide transporter
LQNDVKASDWFGQPRGLTVLILTETWERFSYYGMRSLLVYYMVRQLLMAQERASIIYGLYTACVFLTPIAGGIISDRWLGRRNSVVIGGSILATGHFMMASSSLFFPGLATIAIGNGLFLPSLPSQIKTLYAPDDPRGRSAFNFYYVGTNVGAFLAPLGCGTIGELYGWHWGFTLAGFGVLAGLTVYLAGGRYLPPEPLRTRAQDMVMDRAGNSSTLRRFALLSGIGMAIVVFRIAYEQIGNTLPLWIESVDRSVGDFVVPMTWFQSLNPLLVFMLTPWLVARWLRMARLGREPSSVTKMARGAFITAFSFLMLAGAASTGAARQTGVLWLIVFFIVMTLGELCILPVGLGLFGRLAPRRLSATTIALWFFAAFAGNLIAGAFGTLWSRLSPAAFFALCAAVTALSGALLFMFDRAIQRVEST